MVEMHRRKATTTATTLPSVVVAAPPMRKVATSHGKEEDVTVASSTALLCTTKRCCGWRRRNKNSFRSSSRTTTIVLLWKAFAIAVSVLLFLFLSVTVIIGPDRMRRGLTSVPHDTHTHNHHDKDHYIHNTNVEYHIVFSTGCTTIQDWQSYVFFYFAMRNRQPGTITRIASGCSPGEQAALQTFFDEKIASMLTTVNHNNDTDTNSNTNVHSNSNSNATTNTGPGSSSSSHTSFRIHFTPDYSHIKRGHQYKYFNKPYGLRHWFEHSQGFPNQPLNPDAIVILMDPDQIILRPFRDNDFTNTIWWRLKPEQSHPRTYIEHGHPMAQLYGYYTEWKRKVDLPTILGPNVDSALFHMTDAEISTGFAVGPPYMGTAKDMYAIAHTWTDFAVPVHDQYPHLLAEMFAYSNAAAHLGLHHQIARSFMVSDVTMNFEGWNFIDNMPAEEVCNLDHHPEIERKKKGVIRPNGFHYSHRYGLGKYMFGKFRLPKDFMSCNHALFAEPPSHFAALYNYTLFPLDNSDNHPKNPNHHNRGGRKEWTHTLAKRNAYGTCVMIRALNEATTYYKQQHCRDEYHNNNHNKAAANFDKSFVFVQ